MVVVSRDHEESSLMEEHLTLARRVHRQVWTEFRANKPKDDDSLTRARSIQFAETSKQGSRRALYEQLAAKYPDRINDVPEPIPSDGPDTVGPKVSLSASARSRVIETVNAAPKNIRATSDVRPTPSYTYCDRAHTSIRVFPEFLLPFVPTCLQDDAKAREYNHTYLEAAWVIRGRNPEADIIAIETIKRLNEDHNMPDVVIDATRILPHHCEVYGELEFGRDMVEFPRGDEPPETRRWKRHETGAGPERYHENQEMVCPQCKHYHCYAHIGNARYENSGVRPLPNVTDLDLKNPGTPCDDQCTLLNNSRSTRASSSNQTPSPALRRCTRAESLKLLTVLPAFREAGMITYCDAASMIGVPCSAVAEELRIWHDRLDRRQESKPQTASQEQRSREKSPTLEPDSTQYRQSSFCRHSGPCVEGVCFCVDSQMACEARCHCDGSCKQRWKGCSCHKHTAGKPIKCSSTKCECRKASRECDSAVCVGCGNWADSDSESDESDGAPSRTRPRQGPKCRNKGTLQAVVADTVVKESKGMGFGLYATKHIPKGMVIGEYIGELINTTAECNRRYIVYDAIKRNYLWEVAPGYHVDAFNIGNKTRFMNGAVKAEENATSVVINVQGDPRLIVKASRTIKKGEEIFLYYGEMFKFDRDLPGPSPIAARKRSRDDEDERRNNIIQAIYDDDPNDLSYRTPKKSRKA